MLANLRDKNSRDSVTSGPPHLCKFYLLQLYQALTVNIREKRPIEGKAKESFLYMPEPSALPHKVCAREKLVNQSLTWAVSSEPNYPGG